MAATAISLHFRTKHRRRRPNTNPSFLHFFSSSTPSSDSTNSVDDQNPPSPPPPPPPQSQSSFSSYFSDVKARLKQQQTPSKASSPEEIRKNLAEFSRRYAAPPPANNSSQQQPISFQELYKRRSENSTIEASNKGGGGEGGAVRRPAFDTIRESLRQLNSKKASNNADQVRNNNDPMSLQRYRDMLNMRPVDPNNGRDSTVVIGGTDKQLPASVFGKELREKKENESVPMRTEFTRRYGYDELGVKLRKLRPEGKKGEWFSLGELNERLMKLRELEEKDMASKMAGVPCYSDLRRSLMTLHMPDEEKTKKQMSQRLDVLGQLGGTPNFLLSPPKDHLVEKYFHPDHMSSSEKMKLELQKVRDEFKMSESDCGSARVQVAQLTTKIKHLSTALHKKDKHSRKGLQAMVQRRKKLLKYLRTTDWDSYCLVLSKLGLRDNPDFKILTYPRKST